MIANEKEFGKTYPHLKLVESFMGKKYTIQAKNASWSHIEFPIDNEGFERRLAKENERLEVKYKFQQEYPFLYPFVNTDDLKISSLWVRRGSVDGEAMPHPKDWSKGYTKEEFEHWNAEAKKANEPEMFFCSGCGKAKKSEEYAYFYFSGQYCKECKEKDPNAYRMAMQERYN